MGARDATARLRAEGCALAVALGLIPVRGIAANTLTLGIDVGLGTTDNIYEVASPKTSEIMPTLGLDFGLHREGTTLNADVTGFFTHYNYLRNSYSNDVFGRLDGIVKLALVPERLTWVLQESFGQAALNLFEPLNPGNRENVNFVSTGPDLSLDFGLTGFMHLGARYASVQYQTSPFDSKRPRETFAVGRQLSDNSALSLNADAEQVRFDNTVLNTNFDRREAYLRYQARGARTLLAVNLGATEASASSGWYSSPLAQLDLTRRLTPYMTLVLSVGRELTDAADGFRDLQAGAAGGFVTAPVAGTSDSYVARYVSAGWRLELNRTTVAASDRYGDDTYLTDSIFDAKRNDFELNIGRRLTPVLGVQLLGSVLTNKYYRQNFESNDHLAGAALVMLPARKVEVRLRYDHLWRTASGVGSTTFDENRIFLLVTYRPVGATAEVNPTGLPVQTGAPLSPGRQWP
jgi:hypothetical protein